MAFCTKCGAPVTGAFCNQCGTASSGAAAPPVQAAPPAPVPGAMPMPYPAPRKTSPFVWIVVAILGIIFLGIVGIFGTAAFFVHRARSNPAAALARVAAMSNHNLVVVGQDDRAGTVTVRDRESGKTVTLNFNDAKEGKFHFSTEDENGKTADLQIGGPVHLPGWVPVYPGAEVQANFTGRASDGEGGNVTYTTSDDLAKVNTFYQDKAKELGMQSSFTSNTADGSMMVATDDANNRSLTVVIANSSGKTTINLTYGSKK